jgi:hypothetical protein
MTSARLQQVFGLIDEANSHDPTMLNDGGIRVPAELIYGQRSSAMLERYDTGASELLSIAARGHHIERWKSPRRSFPEGRVGYLKWRMELRSYHARRCGELMEKAGYSVDEIERAGQLIRKERLSSDREVQTLEDVICLVFLRYYADAFIAPHDDEKVIDILAKTARKMSPAGIQAAAAIPISDRLSTLLAAALSKDGLKAD